MTTPTNKAKINQIISRKVISVTSGTPLDEAVGIMARARISCLVVAENDRPLGIFTERDLVRLANRHATFGSQPISTVMTSPVVTISGSLNIYEAYSLMLTNRIRHHVVIDHSGKLLGLITQTDLIDHLGHEYFLEMRKIEQVMTTSVVTVAGNTPVSKVLAVMAKPPGISCAVVAEEHCPLGILTERDAVQMVANGINLTSALACSVMNSPVVTVKVGTTVHKTTLLMKKEGIRHVVVVGDDGRIAGIITQSDIVKGLEGKYIELLKEIIQEKEDVFRQTAKELLDKTILLDNILNSSVSMAIVATDDTFKIKYFNPVAERVFGCSSATAIGRSVLDLLVLEDIAPLSLPQAREIVQKEGKCLFPVDIKQDDAHFFYDGSLSGILDRRGNLSGFVLMLNDVTERRHHEDTIHYLAYHDALTGLPNRALLNDRLSQALSSAIRTGTCGALMMLDLDRFKDVNDTLGHSMGDQLLKAVGERLTGLLRKSDTVCRMGGDEFVLLLPTAGSVESATMTAAKIIAAFREPFICTDHTFNITASIGIAHFPDDGADVEILLKNADIALYRVKELGRNNFQCFT
ncbi:MAG: diguanylate cyclase [Desulfuromonadaceae bacterium]|nr:diguanylate cyclase [Desulfuromonadaceae bacterium]